MNRKVVIVALVAAMALTLTGLAWAHEGCADCDGQCVDYPKRAHMPMLTAEQREEVKARAAELDEQGASPEEVRAAIAEMLEEWGVKRPQLDRATLGRMAMWQQLTPGQREQLKDKVTAMKEDGASGEEIRKVVGNMLKEWGIKPGVGQYGQQAAPPRWGQQAQTPRWGQQAAPLGRLDGVSKPRRPAGVSKPRRTAGVSRACRRVGVSKVRRHVGVSKAPLRSGDGANKLHRPIGDGASKVHLRSGVSNNKDGVVNRVAMVSRPSALGGR